MPNVPYELLRKLCYDLDIPKDGSREAYFSLKTAADTADYIDHAKLDGYTDKEIDNMVRNIVHYHPRKA